MNYRSVLLRGLAVSILCLAFTAAPEAMAGEQGEPAAQIAEAVSPADTVTDQEGHTSASEEVTVDLDSDISAAVPTLFPNAYRVGYKFLGWSESSDQQKNMHQPGDIIEPDAESSNDVDEEIQDIQKTFYYAVWESYKVTLDGNGQILKDDKETLDIENDQAKDTVKNIRLPLPARQGYQFLGWSTEKDGSGTMYQKDDLIPVIDDLVLYAQWQEEKKQEVTLDYNGGSDKPLAKDDDSGENAGSQSTEETSAAQEPEQSESSESGQVTSGEPESQIMTETACTETEVKYETETIELQTESPGTETPASETIPEAKSQTETVPQPESVSPAEPAP